MGVLGRQWVLPEAELRTAFEKEGARYLWSGIPNRSPEVFCLAFPQFISPGYRRYAIERALGRDAVGVAVAAWVDLGMRGERFDPVQGRVYARIEDEYLELSINGIEGDRSLLVSRGNGNPVVWRVSEAKHFYSARVSGVQVGGLAVENDRALWSPNGRGVHAEFRLSVHRPFNELVSEVAQRVRETGLRNDDVLFDRSVDYGVPYWALGGVLLGIRMLLLPEDF